jgi:hypothetical protein
MKPCLSILCLVSCTLAGCMSTSPIYDARFGDANRVARAAQTLDPGAPSRNVQNPVIDAKATAGAQTGYATSYGYAVKEVKQSVITLVPGQ